MWANIADFQCLEAILYGPWMHFPIKSGRGPLLERGRLLEYGNL